MKSLSKELIGAFALPVILSVLQNNDSYGYEILQQVKDFTNGEVSWQEASIYPLLKKMEKEGLIKSYWKVTKNERPRKYYTLLKEGQKQLEHNQQEWHKLNSLFQGLWNPSV